MVWPALFWTDHYGPLCRPQADAVGGGPRKVGDHYGPLCRPQADAVGGGPRKVGDHYGPSSYRAQGALRISHAVRAPTRCALGCGASLLTTFAELEPLCRPQADAMGGGPRKIGDHYGPSSYRAQGALHVSHTVCAPIRCAPARGASLLTRFAELEPLCRPQADAARMRP